MVFSVKKKPTVLVVTGATASGKSDFALEYARKNNGVLICADSIQLYQGLPLLTACPIKKDLHKVPHLLYQYLPAHSAYFSVTAWRKDVLHAIEDVFRTERQPILVGGTGFYLKALWEGLAPIPPVPQKTVKNFSGQPLNLLWAELCRKDAASAKMLKRHDKQRIVRALSVLDYTGMPLNTWQAKHKCPVLPFEIQVIHVSRDTEELNRRILLRLEAMWQKGVCEEVRLFSKTYLPTFSMRSVPEPEALLSLSSAQLRTILAMSQSGFSGWPVVTKAIGFIEILMHILGAFSVEEAKERILWRTRQYAKRQRTWFRHQLPSDVSMLTPDF